MSTAARVVFGDDGSANADRAFAWITHQPWPGWRLEVVHAELPPIGPPLPEAETRLHPWEPPTPRVVADAVGFLEVTHLTARVDPRVALGEPADLVVVGPRGTGLLKALHLGSTAEWLLARPMAPIVVARGAEPVRRVIVAHDGSDDADAATRAFAGLPLAAGADVTVVVVADGRTDATLAADRARVALGPSLVEPRIHVVDGSPTHALVDALDAGAPDLVVVGTRGLSPWPFRGLGSTANAIVRGAACTVLVARAAADDTTTSSA